MGQYGHFDDQHREYVITKPLTPRPWINYLTNNRVGAFVSQGAGGLAWYHQPVTQRISRYDFMGLPEDRPGFYVYIREADGSYWSPSYQPCQTRLDRWECRHGMGYTRFIAERGGLSAELVLFVPVDDDVLLWDLTVTNNGDKEVSLFLTNYLEFSLLEYYKEILAWVVLRNQVRFFYDPELEAVRYEYFVYEAEHINPILVSSSDSPSGYDCDRSAFIGRGRSTADPIAVERGKLANTELPGGGLGIAALSHDVVLQPGHSKRIVWCVAAADTWDEAGVLAMKYKDLSKVTQAFVDLKHRWDQILSVLDVDLPDKDMQSIVGTWNPYGANTTFFRDRDISTDLPGLGAGIRFRDAMQNCMTMCSLEPSTARERIELLLSHQLSDGSTLDIFRPGAKVPPHNEEPRCDNPVWSPMTVYLYLAETGDMGFLDKVLPYVDEGEGTVYDHLMNGLKQIARDIGDNGLPLLKGRDWDDHLALFREEGAESVMTAQNWCYAGRLMQEICQVCGHQDDARWIEGQIDAFAVALNTAAWDGEWYIQLIYRGDKVSLGSSRRRENKIYINSQAWAVISRTAPEGRDILCMDKMREYLNTGYGIKMIYPAYTGVPEPEDRIESNGPGLGENGGNFIQANCWAIMAEAMLGRGDRAYEYYRQVLPPVISEKIGPDVYLNEPYMFSSHIIADPDTKQGMANLSWLTGTVNWMYVVATQYILGIRPTLSGLLLDPCLPSHWDGFRVRRKFRGATYDIEVAKGEASSPKGLWIGGESFESRVLPIAPTGQTVSIRLVL